MTDSLPIEEPKFSIKPEEILSVFKNILPQDLANGLIKAKKNNDEKELANIQGRIESIVQGYQSKMLNFNFNTGEQALWVNDITKGIFHKELVEKWVITNLRAFKFFPITNDRPKAELASIGLHISDTVVMNQYRNSSGSRIGSFVGGSSGGSFSGVGTSSSSSTSRTYGNLVFLLAGKEVLCFGNITDPNGVKKLIQTVKKQTISV